jgi:hypothetical protein
LVFNRYFTYIDVGQLIYQLFAGSFLKMFGKKRRWGWATLKALFWAQIFYRCARFFLKAVLKQSRDTDMNSTKRFKAGSKKTKRKLKKL